MAVNSVSSEEFSFPSLASQDSSQTSGTDSPPLWKHSPENCSRRYDDGRLIIGRYDEDDDLRKSFSYVERKSLWNVIAEEKMDMMWEELNDEPPPPPPKRSQSLRIGLGGEKKSSLVPDESSAVGCGIKLTRKTSLTKMKMSTNVLVLMRVLKKVLVIRSSCRRSPTKTHPR